MVAGVALPQNPNSAPFRFSLGYHNITIPGDRSHHAPVPKHVIIDRDKDDNEYYTRLFAKEQSYRSMLRILGIDGNGFSDRKFRNVRHRYESTGFLIEGRDFYSTTWLAQELNTTPRQLHQFLAEKGICKFSKNQWVAFMPYRSWQIDMPYYWNNLRTGKCHAAGTRKRWSKIGRDQILELWNREPPKRPELPSGRRRVENPYSHLTEGADYFTPTQLAREIGISASRMSKFLEDSGICRFVKKQWAVLPEYREWQIDVPYYWTNPKTQKRWAFGTRKRWTLLGREKIIELWNNGNAGKETEVIE